MTTAATTAKRVLAGQVEWAGLPSGPSASSNDDRTFDRCLQTTFMAVSSGDTIGRIIAKPTNDSGQPEPVIIGNNVVLAADGFTAMAMKAGKAVLKDRILSIEDVLEIPGNVDSLNDNIDSKTHIVVRGSITAGTKVRTSRSLLVGGAIEAATINSGEDVVVNGGIVTRETGRVSAAGMIVARFCDNAQLSAGGEIHLGRECINSLIETQRRLIIEDGGILGGEAKAQHGIVAKALGCEAGTATRILMGSKLDLLRKQREIELKNAKRLASLTGIRKSVGPLLAGGKRLTAGQREQATELMFQADTLEIEIKESIEQIQREIKAYEEILEAALAGADVGPSILVQGCIFPGVQIQFDDLVTIINNRITGPVHVRAKSIEGRRMLVAIEPQTGEVVPLKTDVVNIGSHID